MTKNEGLAYSVANALIDSGGTWVQPEPCRSCNGDFEFHERKMIEIILMILEEHKFDHHADGI